MGPTLFVIHFNDLHTPLKFSKIITYADDSVIYASSKYITMIQKSLREEIHNLSHWFKEEEMIINLKEKGRNLKLCSLELQKKSTLKTLNVSNRTYINNRFAYKYLGFDLDPNLNLTSRFDRTYKKAAGRVILLRSIRWSIDPKCPKIIYKAMILSIFTYCGSLGRGWSNTRKSLIKNIEQRSLEIIGNSNLKRPSAKN